MEAVYKEINMANTLRELMQQAGLQNKQIRKFKLTRDEWETLKSEMAPYLGNYARDQIALNSFEGIPIEVVE